MARSVRANIELASEANVTTICKKDAPNVSSNPSRFVKENLLGYYVITNTWLMMIRQWSEYGWTYVLQYILTNGLFSLIREFDQAAAQLIHGDEVSFSIARMLLTDIRNRAAIIAVPHDAARTTHFDPMSAALTIFRYGKRFSPLEADKLRDASIQDFVDRQRLLKYAQRQSDNVFIDTLVREEISNMLDWKSLTVKLNSVDLTDIIFTPGVSFDTRADLVSKLRFVAKERVEYFPMPFGIPLVSHIAANGLQYWNGGERHTVRIVAVPKNYKTARVIAPEDVIRQAYARAFFNIADSFCPCEIRLHDQSQNQRYALQGSLDGSLATIDLSAASDSITWSMIVRYFPNEFVDVIRRVLPTHYLLKDHVRLLQSAATMGNSITFWLESVLFLGIARAAVKLYNRMTGAEDSTISVYGDDIIVPTDTTCTVIDFLERIGFTVNTDKSYFSRDLLYRESCGEEYLRGVNVSSVYFPRFPLEGNLGGKMSNRVHRDGFLGTQVDTLTSLVDLQHKMFNVCVPASILLSELIREAEPRMTTSTPEEGFMDIWSYESTPKPFYPPCVGEDIKKWLEARGIKRWGHLTPIAVPNKPEKPGSESVSDRTLYDLYKYQDFLKKGPRFTTPLDRILGVSNPSISFEEASLNIQIRWVYVK